MRSTYRCVVTIYQLKVAFSFALEALIYETRKELGWTDTEILLGKELRGGRKIPGYTRMFGDRFARFCSDMRLLPVTVDHLWDVCFEVSRADYREHWAPHHRA